MTACRIHELIKDKTFLLQMYYRGCIVGKNFKPTMSINSLQFVPTDNQTHTWSGVFFFLKIHHLKTERFSLKRFRWKVFALKKTLFPVYPCFQHQYLFFLFFLKLSACSRHFPFLFCLYFLPVNTLFVSLTVDFVLFLRKCFFAESSTINDRNFGVSERKMLRLLFSNMRLPEHNEISLFYFLKTKTQN